MSWHMTTASTWPPWSLRRRTCPPSVWATPGAYGRGNWCWPWGIPWGVPGAVTAGAVIEIGPYTLEKSPWEREWIVAGLRLRPGHSGGPMMDVEGRLVGINTMITGPEVAATVPVHVVKTFLHDKLETEKANLVA